jgi:hypothetical protein
MLMFFGIINFMESIMNAREALLKIKTVLDVSESYLVNGGLELSETELVYIKDAIQDGLENTDVQN